MFFLYVVCIHVYRYIMRLYNIYIFIYLFIYFYYVHSGNILIITTTITIILVYHIYIYISYIIYIIYIYTYVYIYTYIYIQINNHADLCFFLQNHLVRHPEPRKKHPSNFGGATRPFVVRWFQSRWDISKAWVVDDYSNGNHQPR